MICSFFSECKRDKAGERIWLFFCLMWSSLAWLGFGDLCCRCIAHISLELIISLELMIIFPHPPVYLSLFLLCLRNGTELELVISGLGGMDTWREILRSVRTYIHIT
ncbi:hypothetical protein B0T22DRAFT_232325 [Podospora appendiculata]|uniref:Uncharacterized protein n=1 Tax=Podospora appendiculata TaxID=314037 RepID=A0AAE0X6J6_9PEZI|nr:hypothetical protein B0T22DRAFT_232325 [Podospora appendiculata]